MRLIQKIKSIFLRLRFLDDKLTKISVIVACLILCVFLWIDIENDFSGLSLGRQSQNGYGKEMAEVLTWLKNHSSPEDVVLSEWTEGNFIVAIADRGVVSTSKVYPSEAKEVAQRYGDLRKFFFAESENDAMKIIKKYKVRWIYLRKNPEIVSILKGEKISSQRYVKDGRLTQEGIQKTIIGKLLSCADFSNFQLALDSPDFLIYRVKPFEPSSLTDEKKISLLALARQTMKSRLFGGSINEPIGCEGEGDLIGADVAIYVDGQLRGSQIVYRETIEQSVIEAASRTIKDPRFDPLQAEELKRTTIEIYILGDKISIGNLDYSAKRLPDYFGRQGFYLKDNKSGKEGYYLPVIFNKLYFSGAESFLSSLCKKGDLPDSCYKDKSVEIYVYDGQHFAEDSSGGLINYDGTVSLNNSSREVNHLSWEDKLNLAAKWLQGRQLTYGSFLTVQDPIYGNDDNQARDLLRDGFSALALFEAHRLTDDNNFLSAAKLALEFLNNDGVLRQKGDTFEVIEDGKRDMGNLTFLIRANLAIYKETGRKKYLQAAKVAADRLLLERSSEGALFSSYGNKAGKQIISDIFSGQGIAALSLLAQVTGEDTYRAAAIKATNFWQTQFRLQRRLSVNKELSLAAKAWLVSGAFELYQLTRDQQYAKLGLEVADWLISYQRQNGPAVLMGSFPNTPDDDYSYTAGTGKVAEALVDAYRLSSELVWPAEKYKKSLEMALNWLSLFQYRANEVYFFAPEIGPKVIGGLRLDYRSPVLRTDFAGHYIMAAGGLVDIIKNEK